MMKRSAGLLIFLLNLNFISAQDPGADILKKQFQNAQSNTLQEKLFVHTNKTFYLAGETVWFKIYSVDASFHKPLPVSCIAYIEIINKDFKPVIQSKIAMKSGTGNGSVNIPGFLASGNYIIRAYTSWMKNFPADYYFEQTLRIVNTLKPSVTSPVVKQTASIQFFPEGGNGLAGFPGIIGFKATGSDGRGLNCTGVIVNQQNDTVLRFQSLYNGMGNFRLQPEKNTTYYALVRVYDSLIKQKLPEAAEHGMVMNVSDNGSDKFLISVHTSPDFNNTTVYLFAQTRQVIKNVQVAAIKENETSFLVDKKDLGDGISGITLFNQNRQPVCERLVFKRPVETWHLDVKTDQSVYNTRKPVRIELTNTDTIHKLATGNCSMSVFSLDSLQQVPEPSIISYLFLSSDLKGKIETPEYYFTNPDKAVDQAMDNLLLTQGWRRFKWSDVFEYRKPAFEFLPEMEGAVVNGKIINKLTGTPVAASGAYLSIPGADYAFSSATSDAQGNIRFGFKDIEKNNAVVVQPAQLKDSNYRIDIGSSYSDKYALNPIPSYQVSKEMGNTLLNRSIGNQVENTYETDKKRRFVIGNADTTSFYGKADKTYKLDEFTRFQTMEEVMREYIEDLRVRKERDKYTFRVRNKLFNIYFEESPLILLDGIPVSDASKIIALDPMMIKRIELVTYNYYLGSSVFSGIVNVKSYSGELGSSQIDPNSVVVEFEGLQPEREFYSPNHNSDSDKESHMPDFRNALYWAPQIKPGINGNNTPTFYTSDIKGKFAVVVQGISSEGNPGSAVTFFEVADSK